MKRCEISAALYDNQSNPVRDFKLELVAIADNQHQTVITVTDHATGASTVTKLPISDYTNLWGKLNKSIANLDPQSIQKLATKLMGLISFLG